jgi:transcriptional pleiotropic regulator of transition state genes
MKATGIVRKIDPLGRIVVPAELRKTLNIKEKEPFEIYVENNDTIIFKKYEPACTFCGEARDTSSFKGKIICSNCLNTLLSSSEANEESA